jgi:metal-dependent HD superfamily phosphatase/phosphodiesterase
MSLKDIVIREKIDGVTYIVGGFFKEDKNAMSCEEAVLKAIKATKKNNEKLTKKS